MEEKRPLRVPYAVSNYEAIRDEGFYYVDKTMFIPRLEEYRAPVFLRPRRFGKTLLVYTLEAYYDRTKAHRFHELFDGTYIGAHPTPRQGSHIIVHTNFSLVEVSKDIAKIEESFNRNFVSDLNSAIIRNSDIMPDLVLEKGISATAALKALLAYVSSHHLPSVYLLIDEYDNFTNQLLQSQDDDLYEIVTTGDSFLRTFFKAIKSGLELKTIATCYCTGVLPATMDDLTSGYNVAEVITLEPEFYAMAGFTHDEARPYVKYILDNYTGGAENFDEIWQLLINNYDSYHFSMRGEALFNSTIMSYFLKKYQINKEIPDILVDENVRVDLNWIKRLTLSSENARIMVDNLLYDGYMQFDTKEMKSRFTKAKFFDPEFYPVSMFYLGMVTMSNMPGYMVLPNLTLREIFMDYYNNMNHIKLPARCYNDTILSYYQNPQFEILTKLFHETALQRIPAQAFDKVNENFIRTLFFSFVNDRFDGEYTFALENNLPSGRSDFEMIGVADRCFGRDIRVAEFKYFKADKEKTIKGKRQPAKEDKAQALAYARDLRVCYPRFTVRSYVVYVCANKVTRCWEVKE